MDIPHSSKYDKTPASFPNRLPVGRRSPMISVQLDQNYGGRAKTIVRNTAKRCKEYFARIEITVNGRTDEGEAISIDNVGKWLFGTPGYKGHVIVENWEGTNCNIYYPESVPEEAIALINAIVVRFS